MLPTPPAPLQARNPPLRGIAALTRLEALQGSLAQRVHASLHRAIMDLQFAPGEALKKPEICAVLGVSRSPVSEAIARLQAERLVDVVPQAGTTVARFSMAELHEGAFLREALELAAVEAVAPRLTAEQGVALRRSLRVQEALVADGDEAGFYLEDAAMHRLILGFTGFPRMAEMADTAWTQVNRARRLILPQPGRIRETLSEHWAIVDALDARDPAAARAATRHHLRQLITHLPPLAEAHPEYFSDRGA